MNDLQFLGPDNAPQQQNMTSLLQPTDETRAILYQAVADREVQDKVSPEFFISQYMNFVAMVISHGRPTQDTINSYRWNIEMFLQWCLQKARVSPFKLDERHLELYRAKMYSEENEDGSKKYNESSVKIRFAAIRAFYKAAIKQGIMEKNPCSDVKTTPVNLEDRPLSYYTMGDIKQLVDYVKANYPEFECLRHLVCIYLMGVAGLRCVEVHRANQEDINWGDLSMVVRGKGHNGLIYLDETTANVIQEYLDCIERLGFNIESDGTGTPLIVANAYNRVGTRLARGGIRWNFNHILKGAGMKQKGAACHIFRHSCATALYENTHDLRLVQETLRHRDPSVTARYAHVVKRLKERPTAVLGQSITD